LSHDDGSMKNLSSSAQKTGHSWLGCKAPKLNFCSAMFFLQKVLDFRCGSRILLLGNGRWDNGFKACELLDCRRIDAGISRLLSERGSKRGFLLLIARLVKRCP
jgi:hypothetical protein